MPHETTTRPDAADDLAIFGDAAVIAHDYVDGMADALYALGSTGALVLYWPGAPTVDRQLAAAAELAHDLATDPDTAEDLQVSADEIETLQRAAERAAELVEYVDELADAHLSAVGVEHPDDDRGTAVDARGRTTHDGWQRLAHAIADELGTGWQVSACSPGVWTRGRRITAVPPVW